MEVVQVDLLVKFHIFVRIWIQQKNENGKIPSFVRVQKNYRWQYEWVF